MSQRQSEPDCFETPDVPTTSPIVVDNRPAPRSSKASEEIDNSSLATKEIFSKFADKELDTSKLDYSFSNIARKPLKQFEYGVNPLGKNSQSPLERYNKIRSELESLMSDLSEIEKEAPELNLDQGNKASDISNQLAGLSQLLNQCEKSLHQIGHPKLSSQVSNSVSSQLLKELKAYSGSPEAAKENGEAQDRLVYELYCPKDSKNSGDNVLSDLEKRISQIEKTIGNASVKPIVPLLDVLEEKVSLLDDNKLNLIEAKISTLSDSLSKKQNIFSDSSSEEKVDKIFDTIIKWDSDAEQIPIVVERLVTLKHVHEQSVTAITAVNQIQQDQDAASSLIKSLSTGFEQLQQAFVENLKIIESNTSRLEQRLEDVAQKINK